MKNKALRLSILFLDEKQAFNVKIDQIDGHTHLE